ncbi:transcriptional regulator FtrA [Massilia sp.]|uniref:transcriptional regulator FtrA n=1 Tax=Massilia sp. TaxID=1882437 RepID=UPI00289D4DFA|nr:transcriptional regulator FtrA [Massilia sp.]
MPHHVAILAYDGLCTFEFGCAVELFALERPELGVTWYSHAVCAAEPGPLRAMGGLSVQAQHGLEAIDTADTVIIPGWRDVDEPPPPALLDALRRARARGARIGAICSGAFVLAHAGLLDGKKATTHWRYLERLAAAFPAVRVQQGVLYAQDGNLITSAGSAAGLDMLLHLVRSDFGLDVASRVAQRLVIPAHRDGDQAQLVARPLPSLEQNAVARLMDWVRENLRAEHSVQSMAARAGMGTRTFQRRFRDGTGLTPAAWLVRERVTLAARILETRPALAIDTVADLAGLGSSASLRRHFRSHGLPPPGRYRRLGPAVAVSDAGPDATTV